MDQFNLWRGGCQKDGNRVNSDDRTRQGRAVVHRAGLGRAPWREVIGIEGHHGALEPEREHRRDIAGLWLSLSQGHNAASGLSHLSFSEGTSSFSTLGCCPALLPLALHLTWVLSPIGVFDFLPCQVEFVQKMSLVLSNPRGL